MAGTRSRKTILHGGRHWNFGMHRIGARTTLKKSNKNSPRSHFTSFILQKRKNFFLRIREREGPSLGIVQSGS